MMFLMVHSLIGRTLHYISFKLAMGNLEILIVQHLREIVPKPDIYDMWPEFLLLITDSVTLSCVIWTSLSPSRYSGFKRSQDE